MKQNRKAQNKDSKGNLAKPGSVKSKPAGVETNYIGLKEVWMNSQIVSCLICVFLFVFDC